MRAVRMHKCGGPEVVFLEDVREPAFEAGSVRVRVRAAALNHLDIWVRQGLPAPPLPHTLGSDMAGVIEAVADDVEGWSVGDEVIIDPGLSCGSCERCFAGEHSECADFHLVGEGCCGTFAEQVVVPAACCFPRPPHMSWEESAAFGLVFLTAYRMLFTRGQLRAGETVLIVGVGGGVATAALQLAVAAGARVLVTSSSEAKLCMAAELGAAGGIDYTTTPKVAKAVLALTDGRGVDMVVDSVGQASWKQSLLSLRKGGRLVTCGATTGGDPSAMIQRIFWNQLSVLGSTMGSRGDMRAVLALAEQANLKPVVDKVFPLGDAQEAFARLERGEQFGKIVLNVCA